MPPAAPVRAGEALNARASPWPQLEVFPPTASERKRPNCRRSGRADRLSGTSLSFISVRRLVWQQRLRVSTSPTKIPGGQYQEDAPLAAAAGNETSDMQLGQYSSFGITSAGQDLAIVVEQDLRLRPAQLRDHVQTFRAALPWLQTPQPFVYGRRLELARCASFARGWTGADAAVGPPNSVAKCSIRLLAIAKRGISDRKRASKSEPGDRRENQ